MARRPKRKTVSAQVLLVVWGTGLRKFATLSFGTVGIITAAIIGTSNALPIIEPYTFPMWRTVVDHVRSVTSPLILAQNQQAIGMDRFLLYNLKKDIDAAHKDPAAVNSPTAQERINDLKQQQRETEDRIQKATGAR